MSHLPESYEPSEEAMGVRHGRNSEDTRKARAKILAKHKQQAICKPPSAEEIAEWKAQARLRLGASRPAREIRDVTGGER